MEHITPCQQIQGTQTKQEHKIQTIHRRCNMSRDPARRPATSTAASPPPLPSEWRFRQVGLVQVVVDENSIFSPNSGPSKSHSACGQADLCGPDSYYGLGSSTGTPLGWPNTMQPSFKIQRLGRDKLAFGGGPSG
ncbi:hypothetical protein C8034_v010718 [Colletotrichum sidae]|uniref:Uncharacterized protein n=1 Tax=Colletotrichum sidae TaxID=1347389 RepID=A0A4R8TK38_9PEZI|nr:hypothetical protein C8034_v010718 [Colletotrichum sidae]